MKHSEVLKEVRLEAKKVGLTFKKANVTINGKQGYKFTDRLSGSTKLENCTLGSAYENCCNGYISRYDNKVGCFVGITNR